MKRIIRTAAAIGLLFATVTGFANDDKLSLINKKESKSLIFELDAKGGDTRIALEDAQNHVIYFEKVTKISYAKKFDLNFLENGLYYFKTEDTLKNVVYTIEISNEGAQIVDKKETPKAIFKNVDGKVYLNLLNLSKKDVEIKVYDSDRRLLFSEKRKNEIIIEKVFNFSGAHADNYTVVVDNTSNTYYKDIVVK